MLVHMIVGWLVSALALWVVAQIVPGIEVRDFGAALLATVVIAIVGAVVGPVLRFLAWPLTFVTLGLFLLVINGLMILLASNIVRGFQVRGFVPAFLGAIVLALLGMLIKAVMKDA